MTDVEHISRKGAAVPISWFPVERLKGYGLTEEEVWDAARPQLRHAQAQAGGGTLGG